MNPPNERRPGDKSTEAATMFAGSGIQAILPLDADVAGDVVERVVETFDEMLAACTGPDDPMFKAAALLADYWHPALASSYKLGRADGYTAGYWQAKHEMFEAWHAVVADLRGFRVQSDSAARARRESGAA